MSLNSIRSNSTLYIYIYVISVRINLLFPTLNDVSTYGCGQFFNGQRWHATEPDWIKRNHFTLYRFNLVHVKAYCHVTLLLQLSINIKYMYVCYKFLSGIIRIVSLPMRAGVDKLRRQFILFLKQTLIHYILNF